MAKCCNLVSPVPVSSTLLKLMSHKPEVRLFKVLNSSSEEKGMESGDLAGKEVELLSKKAALSRPCSPSSKEATDFSVICCLVPDGLGRCGNIEVLGDFSMGVLKITGELQLT